MIEGLKFWKWRKKPPRPAVWTGKQMARYFSHLRGVSNTFTIISGHTKRRGLSVYDVIDAEQVQPNGIDLRVDRIFTQKIGPTLAAKKEHTDPGMLLEIQPEDLAGLPPGNQSWFLDQIYYVVEWKETITIPKNAIGLLSPRSTLLRLGGTIVGAVWDRGYEGKGRSGLILGTPMLIQRGARLAQMIFIDAQEDDYLYEGQYQFEQMEKG